MFKLTSFCMDNRDYVCKTLYINGNLVGIRDILILNDDIMYAYEATNIIKRIIWNDYIVNRMIFKNKKEHRLHNIT